MDIAVNERLAALGDYAAGASGALGALSDTFLTWPAVAVLLFAIVLIVVLATTFVYSQRFREVDHRLYALAEAMEEQARALDSMRRILQDSIDVLSTMESRPEYAASAALGAAPKDPGPNAADAMLRQELETLRTEILSDPFDVPIEK